MANRIIYGTRYLSINYINLELQYSIFVLRVKRIEKALKIGFFNSFFSILIRFWLFSANLPLKN